MATPAAPPDDKALVKAFADQHRLHLTRDDSGDLILPGRGGGRLYFANGELCAMWTDGRILKPSRLQDLRARWLWLGERSMRAQDVWVKGIPPESYALAIRLVQCKRKRALTTEQREKFIAIGSQNRFTTGQK